MGTLQSYDDGDGAKMKQLLCMHLHKLFCHFFEVPTQLRREMAKFKVFLRTRTTRRQI